MMYLLINKKTIQRKDVIAKKKRDFGDHYENSYT